VDAGAAGVPFSKGVPKSGFPPTAIFR